LLKRRQPVIGIKLIFVVFGLAAVMPYVWENKIMLQTREIRHMTTAHYILAIDQGTTSTRAMVFDNAGGIVATCAEPLEQHFPQPGWVEHDAAEIWGSVISVCRQAIKSAGGAENISAIGITNQRETTVVWDKNTGAPLHRAIVWQDRRTADFCSELRGQGLNDVVRKKTGLVLDPYFSGTKLKWLLDKVDPDRKAAAKGDICFGTIDSWLIWNLTGGAVHATDATNAARTMLYDIGCGQWDDELLLWLNVPREVLPEVKPSCADFGHTDAKLFGKSIAISGVAGDQQAASIGQACFKPGMIKSTYGTGCFVLANTGTDKALSANKLLTTVAYQLGDETTYALEGSIFMAGATMQWLRDQLGMFEDASETAAMASAADPQSGVYLVPAFTGLGAPYWDANARGALIGLTRGVGKLEIVRAGLEAVAFQTRDLMVAIEADMQLANLGAPERLRVDGGMVTNAWFLQFLADTLNIPVDRARINETTALGAAYLAGLETGIYGDLASIEQQWQADVTFEPQTSEDERSQRYGGWQQAVNRVLSQAEI
jgi:glycerol kinase